MKVKQSHYKVPGGWCSQISRKSTHEGVKVVRLTHLYPPEYIPGTHFYWRLSQPQGHSAAGRIVSMKNSYDTSGILTCDLPACSAVPQPTVPPRATRHDLILWCKVKYNKNSFSILPNFWNAALKTAPCATDICMSKILISKPAGKIIITFTKYATCISQFSASSAASQNTKRKFLKTTKSQILQAAEACGCDFLSRKPVKC